MEEPYLDIWHHGGSVGKRNYVARKECRGFLGARLASVYQLTLDNPDQVPQDLRQLLPRATEVSLSHMLRVRAKHPLKLCCLETVATMGEKPQVTYWPCTKLHFLEVLHLALLPVEDQVSGV